MFVKICGVTSVEDARLAVDLGADAIGVNLVPATKRFVDEDVAARIARAVDRSGAKVVGVVADVGTAELDALRRRVGFDLLQLHGHESPDDVRAVPHAFKAVRIGDASDVELAATFPGDLLLVDARAGAALGGSGATFDWTLVRDLCRARRVLLAGGLTPENVASAIATAAPFGVDVASGVEKAGDPRAKDPEKVRAFIARARA